MFYNSGSYQIPFVGILPPSNALVGMLWCNPHGEVFFYDGSSWNSAGYDMLNVIKFNGIYEGDNLIVQNLIELTSNGLYKSTNSKSGDVLWFYLTENGKFLYNMKDLDGIRKYIDCTDEEFLMFVIKYGHEFL